MNTIFKVFRLLFLFAAAAAAISEVSAAEETQWDHLGEDLSAWQGVGGTMRAWSVEEGVLRCDGSRGDGHAKWIASKQAFDNFELKLEFNIPQGGNSGVFIRAPLEEKRPAYRGMEIQICDDNSPQHRDKAPVKQAGAIYDVVPPSREAYRKVGEWQSLKILCVGHYCAVWLNGEQIISARLDDYPELTEKHPGLLRKSGHIGLQNHADPVSFRKIRIRRIEDPANHPQAPTPDDSRPLNQPPVGFTALFNGSDLSGWRKPEKQAEHWTVEEGVLHYDGQGSHLISQEEFGDFILYADWKIDVGGDSGIFPRGAAQVQIWDRNKHKEGSGGIWNNKKTGIGRKPIVPVDNPVGQWNTFRIQLIGEKVTVHLNGKLVVDEAPMERLRQGDRLIERGPIHLQHHGHPLWFRNIYLKELQSDP